MFWVHAKIGSGSILSNMYVRDTEIPENIVVHGLQLPENKYLVRVYGVKDNPKNLFAEGKQLPWRRHGMPYALYA